MTNNVEHLQTACGSPRFLLFALKRGKCAYDKGLTWRACWELQPRARPAQRTHPTPLFGPLVGRFAVLDKQSNKLGMGPGGRG